MTSVMVNAWPLPLPPPPCFAATKFQPIGAIVDKAYDLWAVNRLRVTGRPDLEEVLKQRAEKLRSMNVPDDCSDECVL